MSAQFHISVAAPYAVAQLQHELNIPHFLAATLVGRGFDTPEKAYDFMTPSLEKNWRDPFEIPGLAEVADTIDAAISAGKHIVVSGDFDLDGISATTVMTRGLRALGANATPFIPRRFEDGYGLSASAYARIKLLEPDLVVTVDCGISCRDEVAAIVASGCDVCITDHHEAGNLVPVGVPLCDPKISDDCESSILAGVGVALKIIQVLGARHGRPYLWREFTDFATLGTVADLMPMVGENRALVADGLARINRAPRPCISALIAQSGATLGDITSTNLSFSLVPRLNAAGRMGDAQVALDLLMTDNYAQAVQLAGALEEINNQRRAIEAELSVVAKEKAAQIYQGQRCLVVAGEGWHEGVKGIVASRLVNIYGVPAILFTIDGEEARGSGRSVGNVNLFAALGEVSDLLTQYGGHEAAVGVTLPAKNLPEFARRMAEVMEKLPESEFQPMVEIDAMVSLDELTISAVEQINLLAPFGQENPNPLFLAHNVAIENPRAVGADKNHFSCRLSNGRSSIGAILFHCDNVEVLLSNRCVVDAAFTLQVDEWRGQRNVKAMLSVLEPARMCGALKMCIEESKAAMRDACEKRGVPEAYKNSMRQQWEELGQRNPQALEAALIQSIIGDNTPHPAQREILNRLRAGESTLGVMATGRGKSLIFQVYAAQLALTQKKASLFVYPLRALMADQAFHLSNQFARFGLVCEVLNGESPQEQRKRVYEGLAAGSIDIVMTTPEYLSFHAPEIASCGRIGFMVVDEAHHVGMSKAGTRPAYSQLNRVVEQLGEPVVLAVTATAPEDVTRAINATLPIESRVVDDASRPNLHVNDQRNVRNRDDYLAHLIAGGGKTVVYVNSREQSVGVARRLRGRVPQLAPQIGFYNAGLPREERNRVESLFRAGIIQVLVSTSAFGEGIDIPDIRHVVLYHMPFNEVEFNQMSGRAGRDGHDAWVHLLYGSADAQINEGILADMTPNRDVMAQVYRHLCTLQQQQPGVEFQVELDDLARLASSAHMPVTPTSAACGVAVFRELGLIDERESYNNGSVTHLIRVKLGAPKVELTDSVRYCEGLGEIETFRAFRNWAMQCDLGNLTIRVTHPIMPSDNS